MKPVKAFLSVALLLALLAGLAQAEGNSTGFDDSLLTVTITANKDGSAHVREDVELVVSPAAADLYRQSIRSTRLTIEDWRNTTESKNLRYHVLWENATPTNTRLFPQPLIPLTFVERWIAVITVDYDTSGPIFDVKETGPRRSNYSLLPYALSFENSPGGQVLPENTVLIINVPENSRVNLSLTSTVPPPTFPRTSDQVSTSRYYVWNATGSAFPLSDLKFSFITEMSLDEEVSAYVRGLQGSLTSLVFSSYGAVAVFIAISLSLLFLALKQAKII